MNEKLMRLLLMVAWVVDLLVAMVLLTLAAVLRSDTLVWIATVWGLGLALIIAIVGTHVKVYEE